MNFRGRTLAPADLLLRLVEVLPRLVEDLRVRALHLRGRGSGGKRPLRRRPAKKRTAALSGVSFCAVELLTRSLVNYV